MKPLKDKLVIKEIKFADGQCLALFTHTPNKVPSCLMCSKLAHTPVRTQYIVRDTLPLGTNLDANDIIYQICITIHFGPSSICESVMRKL